MAIEKAMKDSSAYVRKAAAHAITKVYRYVIRFVVGYPTYSYIRLDPEKKDQLIGIIKVLLADTSTMVLGSAVAAFMEVSPDHIDLIHPHYRKLCRVLADVDEWGQIFIINLLIRYGRSQFTCPDPALLVCTGLSSHAALMSLTYSFRRPTGRMCKQRKNHSTGRTTRVPRKGGRAI